jgi:hypothetical protein
VAVARFSRAPVVSYIATRRRKMRGGRMYVDGFLLAVPKKNVLEEG